MYVARLNVVLYLPCRECVLQCTLSAHEFGMLIRQPEYPHFVMDSDLRPSVMLFGQRELSMTYRLRPTKAIRHTDPTTHIPSTVHIMNPYECRHGAFGGGLEVGTLTVTAALT